MLALNNNHSLLSLTPKQSSSEDYSNISVIVKYLSIVENLYNYLHASTFKFCPLNSDDLSWYKKYTLQFDDNDFWYDKYSTTSRQLISLQITDVWHFDFFLYDYDYNVIL